MIWLIWACITAAEAQTPAKKIMGLRVVDKTTGQPLTWVNYVFLRGLVGGWCMNSGPRPSAGFAGLAPPPLRCGHERGPRT
ncbi:hypothetical protein BH23ACT9_BH23ACT9_04140 [soil metagenome]